jgi:hypothetical protein
VTASLHGQRKPPRRAAGVATAWALIGAGVAAASAGCASWFLNGAVEHRGAPEQYVARFTIPECTLSDGTKGPGVPDAWYFLAQDARGPVLYELDSEGEGSEIRNWWSDARGQHFFVWVARSHGWVFSFPSDRSQLPVRFVFLAGTYTTKTNENGMTIPLGQPQATCTLVPG